MDYRYFAFCGGIYVGTYGFAFGGMGSPLEALARYKMSVAVCIGDEPHGR